MHFSTSSTSAPQMEPSAGGIFTMRSLLFMPRPQVALQTSHSPHSVTRQLLGAKAPKGEPGFSYPTEVVTHLLICANWNEGRKLTAFLIDHTVFSLLRGQRAHWAIIWKLLHVTLPRAWAHATGRTAWRPGDPLWHHTGGRIWNKGHKTGRSHVQEWV